MQFKNESSEELTPYFWVCECDEPFVYSVSTQDCPDCGMFRNSASMATVGQVLKEHGPQIGVMFELRKRAEKEVLPMSVAVDLAHLQNIFLGFLVMAGEVSRDEWFERGWESTQDKD